MKSFTYGKAQPNFQLTFKKDWHEAMDLMNWMQWPAMLITVWASWLVASPQESRRAWGFWVFLASNALWIVWGWHTSAWALVTLQWCLIFMNIRGARKNDT